MWACTRASAALCSEPLKNGARQAAETACGMNWTAWSARLAASCGDCENGRSPTTAGLAKSEDGQSKR